MKIKIFFSVVIMLGIGLALFDKPGRAAVQAGQPAAKTPVHAKIYKRLLIRNAMVIYGNGEPAFGPANICIEDGRIARVGPVPKDWALRPSNISEFGAARYHSTS